MARHGLAGSGLDSALAATEAAVGIYSSAPTCYLSCAARVPGFAAADLDQELYQRRRLLRLRCMHGMAYIVSAGSLPVIAAATQARPADIERIARVAGLTAAGYAELSARAEEAVGDGSVTVPELREALGPHAPRRRESLNYAVQAMCREYRLVRAQVRGTWRSNNYAYARLPSWLGGPLTLADPAAARAELARRYLAAYGPASFGDLKWWAGWTVRDTRAALAAAGDEVVPVSIGLPGAPPQDALALAGDLGTLAGTSPDAARGVTLLPVWDTLMMGYERASRVHRLVAPEHYQRVYDGSGNGTSVVLADGLAAGVWEVDGAASMTVRIAPFGAGLAGRWAEAEAAAAGLAKAFGATDLRVERCPEPGYLADGPRNAYLSPISLCAAPGS